MENLQRAIKGFVVMSDELEKVFKALVNNQVPQLWHSVNVYPSLKVLGSWIRDLELRTDFIKVTESLIHHLVLFSIENLYLDSGL